MGIIWKHNIFFIKNSNEEDGFILKKEKRNGCFVDFLSPWVPDVKEIEAEIKTMEKWDNKQNVIQEQKAWKLDRQKIRREKVGVGKIEYWQIGFPQSYMPFIYNQ